MITMFLAVAGSLAAAAPPSILTADAAVVAALVRSPDVAEATAAGRRAQGTRRAECGMRNDPTVRASVAVVGEAWSVSAAQPVSLSGQGVAACATAKHTQDATRARLDRVLLEVAASTRHAWADAAAATSQEDLAAQALSVARSIEVAARQRAAVGDASQLDHRLALFQVEQARSAWMTAAVAEGRSLSGLSTLTGVEVGALVLPSDPLDGAPGASASRPAVRSDVVAARAEVQAARSAVARERAGTLPPVAIGVFVEEEGTELRAGPSVSVTLPIWRRNADGRAHAGAELAATGADADATERRAQAEQVASERTIEALEAALADQPADIPQQARAALDSIALGYDRGELDLLSTALLQGEIIDGHRAWLQGRRDVVGARIDGMLAVEDPALLGEAGR